MHDNNDNDLTKIIELIQKHKILVPISVQDARSLRKNDRKNYISLLKKTGEYTSLLALASYIVFFFKKFGILITTIQSYILMIISVSLIVGGITTGVFYLNGDTVTKIKEKLPEIPINIPKVDEKTKINPASNQDKNSKPLIKKPFILVESFNSEDLDRKTSRGISSKIITELKVLRGNDSIKLNASGIKEYVVLKGDIEYFDNKYTLDVKVYDIKKLNYIMYISETTDDIKKLDQVCKRIAKKINEKLK